MRFGERKPWLCDNCGAKVSGNRRICNKCGTPTMMAAVMCPKCGKDSRFVNNNCVHCGADLRERKAYYMMIETDDVTFRASMVNLIMRDVSATSRIIAVGATCATGISVMKKAEMFVTIFGIILACALFVLVLSTIVSVFAKRTACKRLMSVIGFEKQFVGYKYVLENDKTMEEAAQQRLASLSSE